MRSRRRIHWPDPSKGQDFDLMLDKRGLPYEESARAHPVAGFLLLALAAVALVSFVWAAGKGIASGDSVARAADAVIELACFIEVPLVLGGLYFLRHRKLRLTAQEVSWMSFTVLPPARRTGWVEPVRSYAGILRTVADGGGYKEGTVFHELTLHHAGDASKCVKLCSLPGEAGLVDRQERLARLFGLPALSQTGSGIEAIEPEDLHKPLLKRVQEGSVRTGVRGGEPPRRLRVWVSGDGMVMRGRRSLHLGALIGGLALVGAGALFTAAAWSFPWVWPWGAAVGLLGLAVALLPVIVVQYLRVSPRGVESWHGLGPLRFGRLSTGAASVRQVTIGKAGYHPLLSALKVGGRPGLAMPVAINVIGELRTISFGCKLPPKAQQWVRDCIIAVLTSG